MKKPHRDEPDLIRIGALLLDDRVDSLTDAASRTAVFGIAIAYGISRAIRLHPEPRSLNGN